MTPPRYARCTTSASSCMTSTGPSVRVIRHRPVAGLPPLQQYTALAVPNRDAFLTTKYKLANLGNMQRQLCQPPMLDCPHRRFLDSRGEGVLQIGFERDIDVAAAEGAALGLRELMRDRRANGTGFVYFDTLDEAGVVLMTRQTAPTGSPPTPAPRR